MYEKYVCRPVQRKPCYAESTPFAPPTIPNPLQELGAKAICDDDDDDEDDGGNDDDGGDDDGGGIGDGMSE